MRFHTFDTIRGSAMILMAIYHFSFDLNYYGLMHENMNMDPFWLWFRALIMTLFTGLVGVSFALGKASLASKGYQKRLGQLLFCSILISLATYLMFPPTWTFFGILHFIFLVSLFGPALVRFPRLCLIFGIGLIVLPAVYRDLFFQQKWLIISGLSPLKPLTEDFAPLAPWLGVVMVGVFLGFWAKKNWQQSPKSSAKSQARDVPAWLNWEVRLLTELGKHSLVFYMTHQLALFPIAWAVSKLV